MNRRSRFASEAASQADFTLTKSYHCLQKSQAHLISFSHWKHRKSHFVIGFSTPSQIDSRALCFHSSLRINIHLEPECQNVDAWSITRMRSGCKEFVPDVLKSCRGEINDQLTIGNESKYQRMSGYEMCQILFWKYRAEGLGQKA